jgi:hypothetical protein
MDMVKAKDRRSLDILLIFLHGNKFFIFKGMLPLSFLSIWSRWALKDRSLNYLTNYTIISISQCLI